VYALAQDCLSKYKALLRYRAAFGKRSCKDLKRFSNICGSNVLRVL
ncbi:1377_t:CDS:1, partial [Racocetra fulgida]